MKTILKAIGLLILAAFIFQAGVRFITNTANNLQPIGVNYE